MLRSLNIKDFALVEQLDLEFENGMISLTGETGAGKSILLGAIGLVTGDKADKKAVRAGTEKTIVSATFDISKLSKVKSALEQYDYMGDDPDECILRRIIRKDGRSSCFINDCAASISKIKEIGSMLVEIHGQHQHQSLTKDKKQLDSLDNFLDIQELKENVSSSYKKWRNKEKDYELIKEDFEDVSNKYQLLSYKLAELKELALEEGEFEALEDEFTSLSSASFVISSCERGGQMLDNDNDDDYSASKYVSSTKSVVENLISSLNEEDPKYKKLQNIIEMLESAEINITESVDQLVSYRNKFEINEEREFEVKERVDAINSIANKMNVIPEKIVELKNDVENEISGLNYSEDAVEEAKNEMDASFSIYLEFAKELSRLRVSGAPNMAKAVNAEAEKLNLSDDILKIMFEESDTYHQHGIDKVVFYIRPNKGQEYQPVKMIASGGEMSRLSLSIQVVALKNDNVPTMIFDEVDAGLSGETGNAVGAMLRTVGNLGQVMCVTHLPQVAAQGHSHYFVSKKDVDRGGEEITLSSIRILDKISRIKEIARMIGGNIASNESFENAKLMLNMHNR